MEKSIVQIQDDDLKVSTWDLSKGFDVEHRALTKLIEKYKDEFEELGIVASRMQQIGNVNRGRRAQEYLINEPQSVYLTTLLTNSEKVRKFKLHLTKEFFIQRKLLNQIIIQKQNAEWIEKRQSGKIERRIETDAIKEFVEYAKSQGSSSAEKYYMQITKMENQSLVNIELLQQRFDNIREVLSSFELSMMQMADFMIATCLREGMKLDKFYKDIYQDAKLRVEAFALSMGRTPLRLMMKK